MWNVKKIVKKQKCVECGKAHFIADNQHNLGKFGERQSLFAWRTMELMEGVKCLRTHRHACINYKNGL